MNSLTRVWNYILILVGAALALAIGLGCGNVETSSGEATIDTAAQSDTMPPVSKVEAINDAHDARIAEMRRTAPPGLDACGVAGHVSDALDTIMRWPHPILDGDDACVLAILDSLASGFASGGDDRFLQALDSCRAYGDGYVGEAFADLVDTTLERRPVGFVRYLYRNRTVRSGLEWSLVESWQSRFESTADSSTAKATLLAEIRATVPADSLTTDERAYFETMLKQARLAE